MRSLRWFLHPEWILRSPQKVWGPPHEDKLRVWQVNWKGELELFENRLSTPTRRAEYKNLSYWKNTLRLILSVSKDMGIKLERLEFLVDAPMAARLIKAGALRLDHVMPLVQICNADDLHLPTSARVSSTLTPNTKFVVIDWELMDQPVTLVVAPGKFSPDRQGPCFRIATSRASTIYAIHGPHPVVIKRLLSVERRTEAVM